MKSKELIDLIKRHDPRLECNVRIETVGVKCGIGNSYACYPTIEQIWAGFDWERGELVLRPTEKLTKK